MIVQSFVLVGGNVERVKEVKRRMEWKEISRESRVDNASKELPQKWL